MSMTARTLKELIGQVATLRVDSRDGAETLKFNVVILDARASFGRQDVLVEPVAGCGSGQAWKRLGEAVTLTSHRERK